MLRDIDRLTAVHWRAIERSKSLFLISPLSHMYIPRTNFTFFFFLCFFISRHSCLFSFYPVFKACFIFPLTSLQILPHPLLSVPPSPPHLVSPVSVRFFFLSLYFLQKCSDSLKLLLFVHWSSCFRVRSISVVCCFVPLKGVEPLMWHLITRAATSPIFILPISFPWRWAIFRARAWFELRMSRIFATKHI